MLNWLGGNKETVESFTGSVGKKISALELMKGDTEKYYAPADELVFTFADGSKMRMWDNGQSCCEERYMHTDDDLAAFVGTTLMDGEIKEGPEREGEYGDVHEVEFLVITTSKGAFTIETHNIHNGYYGGFAVRAAMVD